MGMFVGGTISNYVKMKTLNMKWQMRKQNPNMEKGQYPGLLSPAERSKQVTAARISSITLKLKSGQRLSGSEIEFLKENSPELYKKAVQIAEEREQYRKKLENCRTKEDVLKVNAEKLQQFANEAEAISDSSLSKGEKAAELEFILMRQAAIADETSSFMRSLAYQSLPNEDPEKSLLLKPEKKIYSDVDRKKIERYLSAVRAKEKME